MATNVSVQVKSGRVLAITPYDSAFVSRARLLGGKWDAQRKVWSFDARDESNVRGLLREMYGTDGTAPLLADLCRIRVTTTNRLYADTSSYRLAGRTIAQAFGRDSGAKVGEGVVFLANSPDSGGSAKNWLTIIRPGSTFEVRDFPRAAVETAREELGKDATLEVLDNLAPIDRPALMAEKALLEKRLAEIKELLAQEDGQSSESQQA